MQLNSRLTKFIRSIVTISILIYGVYYFYSNQKSFLALAQIDWKILGIMVIFILINIFASSSENAILYRALGAPVNCIESFGLTNVGAFFSLLFPREEQLQKLFT